MNPQIVKDLALHATNRFDRIMEDTLPLLDTPEDQLAFLTVTGEYILRMVSGTLMQTIPECGAMPRHEQSMVVAAIFSQMTAYSFEESPSKAERADLLRIARASALLRQALMQAGFLVKQEQ